MGSKVYTTTEIEDYRQAAEGEIVTGVQSQLAMPGGIALGEGASLSITGATPMDADKTFEALVSSADSTLGKVLGLTSQLAAGIFETTPALVGLGSQIAASTKESLAQATAGMGVFAQTTQQQGESTNKLIIAALVGLGLFLFFRG